MKDQVKIGASPPATPTSTAQPSPPLSEPMATPAKLLTLSVVIPFWNRLPDLLKLVQSLVGTGQAAGEAGRLELLVQDDASPDVDPAGLLGPLVGLARNERNLGFAGTCNAGAACAQGDVLLFLNQDTLARPGWFEALMDAFTDPKVGIVGPKLVFAEEGQPDSIQSCGGLFDAGRGPFHRWLGWDAADWRVNVPERVSWTTGAALAVRRELFGKVGGFDMGYSPAYFEDVAFCLAVRRLGYEIWYEPRAVFPHAGGTSGAATAESFKRNSLRFHREWDGVIVPDVPAIHVSY